MLVNAAEMLKNAEAGHYALGAFNTNNLEWTLSILQAAEEAKSPLIMQCTGGAAKWMGGYKVCADMVKAAVEALNITVPVALHLDHGSYEDCFKCIEAGFTSIMYDGSALSVEENARNTNQVIEFCHAKGVPVEAEIGEIGRLDANGVNQNRTNIADPEQVRKYLQLCRPDSLAVGIGNAHGFYKTEPEIHLEVLEQVRAFTDIPFVLHGCTGMNEDMVRKSLEYGVAKINFGTQVRHNYMTYLREGCAMDFQDHAWKLSQYAEGRLREDIKDIIRLAGSEGRA